jgi:hypothetical protein
MLKPLSAKFCERSIQYKTKYAFVITFEKNHGLDAGIE